MIIYHLLVQHETKHVTAFCLAIILWHPFQQPIQTTISSSFPSLVFLGRCGSAIEALPIDTKSAFPSFKIPSAINGILILFTAITGILSTTFFISSAYLTNGVLGAVVGADAQYPDL